MHQSTEEWLPVVGYEGYYEVSSHGRVRSLDRVAAAGGRVGMRIKGRELRPGMANGRHMYSLCRDGDTATRSAHVMVAVAFLGDRRGEGLEVCHNNGVATDNRVENLRWDTHSSNVLDKRIHGTDHNATKTHCPYGHALVAPNLYGHAYKRACCACALARGQAHHLGVPFSKAVADMRYADVLAGRVKRRNRKRSL